MFHGSSKKCFTIESLVGKEALSGGGSGDEPIRPTALRFSESLHPAAAAAAAAGVFGSCLQGSSGRTLFSGPELVLPEAGAHAHSPGGGLPLHPLQLHPQSFFSPQHREALGFYPWVLRSRYLGHRFQGEWVLQGDYFLWRTTSIFTSSFNHPLIPPVSFLCTWVFIFKLTFLNCTITLLIPHFKYS